MDVSTAVGRWRLEPHPEGGFYRETYRSALRTVPPGWPGERAFATAILYLLPAGERSAWHRVRGDELWLWQGGGPMALHIGAQTRLVGPDPAAGQDLQVLVPAGAWQSASPAAPPAPQDPPDAAVPLASSGLAAAAAAVTDDGSRAGAEPWSLVACLVAPGFDFADFELRGDR
jgi:uncharacterized protein